MKTLTFFSRIFIRSSKLVSLPFNPLIASVKSLMSLVDSVTVADAVEELGVDGATSPLGAGVVGTVAVGANDVGAGADAVGAPPTDGA